MFRNLEAEQAKFGYTNQQMADKSMMFATDNEPREKGDDNDRNDGYFGLSVSSVDLELSVPSSTGEHVSWVCEYCLCSSSTVSFNYDIFLEIC